MHTCTGIGTCDSTFTQRHHFVRTYICLRVWMKTLCKCWQGGWTNQVFTTKHIAAAPELCSASFITASYLFLLKWATSFPSVGETEAPRYTLACLHHVPSKKRLGNNETEVYQLSPWSTPSAMPTFGRPALQGPSPLIHRGRWKVACRLPELLIWTMSK